MKIFFFVFQAVALATLAYFAHSGHGAQGAIWAGVISALGFGPVHIGSHTTPPPPRTTTEARAEVKPARKSA